MHFIIDDLRIPVEKDGVNEYLRAAASRLAVTRENLFLVTMLSKSLDINNLEQFYYRVSIVVGCSVKLPDHIILREYKEDTAPEKKIAPTGERPIIIGFGPAGMFAALECIDYGIRPLIFERGKDITERTIDVHHFHQHRRLNCESNIQFGEGGAGSFSDGKLFSRRNNNSGYIQRVLQTFVKFGAPADILFIGKPHLGTDLIRKIVANIRSHILERGGEIHYNAKMTDILIDRGKATGIVVNGKRHYLSSAIFIATGHSARDTYELMHTRGIALAQKPVSIGIRIEHPATVINRMRYGKKYENYKGLGAATYSLNYTDRTIRRGVYTFCMCPGGEILNASSDQGMLVVNGMSYSHRASPFSNAALVVNCRPGDYPSADPLAGIDFQRKIEEKAFTAGGGNWKVPAQNLIDFIEGRVSTHLNENSCKMGTTAADMNEILPLFVTDGLRTALQQWRRQVSGFVTHQALILAAETRTSAPVHVTRNQNYESINIKNIYPIGEGSGYTGGITSSAADGIKAVEAYISNR